VPVGWFIAPYDRAPGTQGRVVWYRINRVALNFPGVRWIEAEQNAFAVVKVVSDAATLQAINALPGVVGIPGSRLNDPLSSLTAGQKTAIQNQLNAMGYTNQQIVNALGNDLGAVTIGQVLRFAVSRRNGYGNVDPTTGPDFSGPIVPTESIDVIDGLVT
jgi:hypothetical protein